MLLVGQHYSRAPHIVRSLPAACRVAAATCFVPKQAAAQVEPRLTNSSSITNRIRWHRCWYLGFARPAAGPASLDKQAAWRPCHTAKRSLTQAGCCGPFRRSRCSCCFTAEGPQSDCNVHQSSQCIPPVHSAWASDHRHACPLTCPLHQVSGPF
jgi:hypothetical protein